LVTIDAMGCQTDKVERAILFEIEAWDVNCPQHIHKRFSQRQVAPVIQQLQSRIAELEAELRRGKRQAVTSVVCV
jgi:predicted transposase YbfD/YdcC